MSIAARRRRQPAPSAPPVPVILILHVVAQAALILFAAPAPSAGNLVNLFVVLQLVYALPMAILGAVSGRFAGWVLAVVATIALGGTFRVLFGGPRLPVF